MPWSGQSFQKHNHALHGAKAEHAAHIANAVLKSGVDEGESIAIANKWAQHHADGGAIKHSKDSPEVQYGHGMPSAHCGICSHFRAPHSCEVVAGEVSSQGWCKLFKHRESRGMGGPIGYDGGGMIDPTAGSVALNPPALGGITPSASTASPMIAQTLQRYAQMPTEKLQEMAMVMGNSPQGKMVKRALMQKHMVPQVQQAVPQQQAPAMGQAAGGPVAHRDMGGGMLGMGLSQAEPWWTRSEARGADAGPMTGYLHGATAGRADALKGTALSDSYILPAEEIAGLGEGNSLMGARVINAMLGSGPHGIAQPHGRAGHGPPRPPAPPREYQAKGGGVQQGEQPTTKVALSHGEYSMTPEQVMQFTGRNDLKSAHRVMDLFTMELRKRHIKELKGLEPPVGSKQ